MKDQQVELCKMNIYLHVMFMHSHLNKVKVYIVYHICGPGTIIA